MNDELRMMNCLRRRYARKIIIKNEYDRKVGFLKKESSLHTQGAFVF